MLVAQTTLIPTIACRGNLGRACTSSLSRCQPRLCKPVDGLSKRQSVIAETTGLTRHHCLNLGKYAPASKHLCALCCACPQLLLLVAAVYACRESCCRQQPLKQQPQDQSAWHARSAPVPCMAKVQQWRASAWNSEHSGLQEC